MEDKNILNIDDLEDISGGAYTDWKQEDQDKYLKLRAAYVDCRKRGDSKGAEQAEAELNRFLYEMRVKYY